MSEENKQEVAQDEAPKGEETKSQEVDVDVVMKRLEQLESTNKRILEESTTYKNKYRSLRDEVETGQKKQLEDSENWKELLELEKNKNHEMAEKLTYMKKSTLKKELEAKVARMAPDAYDIDDVIRSIPKESLVIDEESLTIKGLDEGVSQVRETKSYLFKKERSTGQTSSRPAAHDGTREKTKEELNKEYKDALLQFVN